MATTQTYKVLYDNINVKSSASLLSSTLGKLKKDTIIEVLDIRGVWAHFKYNNKDAYVITLYLQKVEQVITGSITIKYLNADTNAQVIPTITNNKLSLNVYSYTAPYLEGYTVLEPSVKSVTLTKLNPNQEIIFYYKENIIYGNITVNYIDKSTNLSILEPKIDKDLNLGTYSYSAMEVAGYKLIGDSSKSVTLTKDAKDQIITFEYEKYITENDIYIIDLKKYGISNDNTNGNATTLSINKALVDAKSAGYKRVQLPEGIYSIDTSVKNPILLSDGTNNWTHHRQGVCMLSDMELILEGATLQMIPCEDPYYSIVTISNCKNSKITGGTILGDRETHDYGMRINESGDMFESGDFDSATGDPKVDDTKVRTKDFIDVYKDWFTSKEETLPTNFYITPLWNTTMNTVDGGCRYIYCYDEDNKYLGMTTGGNGYISKATLAPNTAKIKISIRGEKRLDIVLAMTKRTVYYTYEFGSGVTITASDSIEINRTTIKDCIGDCIYTTAPPLKVTVDNLSIIDCTLENSRRQGISFVATGENYLVQGCNIGKINGVDPQCGIDFEHYDYVKDIIIDECAFYDNRKWDIINYNGQDIEIKNSKFTGGIASTFGWNMNIHHNEFSFLDTKNNPKIHKMFIGLETNKTNADNAYFKINNNIIKGYPNAGGTSGLDLSEFIENKIYDIDNLVVATKGCNKNVYTNSKVMYKVPIVINEHFINSTISPYNQLSQEVIFDLCILDDCNYSVGKLTTIRNSKITNTLIPFNTYNWDSNRRTIFEDCSITTKYTKPTQFLNYAPANVLFKNCNFNLSRYLFSLNYGYIEFKSCNIIFNNLNQSTSTVTFDSTAGSLNPYWKFTDCYIESILPLKINTSNIFNCTVNGPISINN